MRPLQRTAALVAALAAGPAFAQQAASVSDYQTRPIPVIRTAPTTLPAGLVGHPVQWSPVSGPSGPPAALPGAVMRVPPVMLAPAPTSLPAVEPPLPPALTAPSIPAPVPVAPVPMPVAPVPMPVAPAPAPVISAPVPNLAPRVVELPAGVCPEPVYLEHPPAPRLPEVGGPLYEPTKVRATVWVRGEALMWWVDGKDLPPIFSESPAGTAQAQAGVLGTPGARATFGEGAMSDPRVGWRVTGGFWLDGLGCCPVGFEGSYFRLGDGSDAATVGGPGTVVSRPFINATGANDAELVNLPGVINGTAAADYRSDFQGADLLIRCPLFCDPCSPRPRLDLIAGYRWLSYGEELTVTENLFPSGGTFADGTNIRVSDRFKVRNDFHGGTLGLAYLGRSGPVTLDLTGRVSVGHLARQVTIEGNTTVTVPGQAATVSSGGLLAQRSNIGTYADDTWTVVPEVEARLGYDVTSRLRVTVGYSVLALTGFYRVGNVIDPVVNRNLIPPTGTGAGPQRPAYDPTDGSIFVHGLTLGAELRF